MELNVLPEFQNISNHKLEKKIVGFFSTNEYGRYRDNVKSLRYLNWQKFISRRTYFDLNEFSGRVGRTKENEHSFYRYLCNHRELIYNLPVNFFNEMSFICNETALRCIYTLPYTYECISLMACLYEGKIHLRTCKNDDNIPLENFKKPCNIKTGYASSQDYSWRWSNQNPYSTEYGRLPIQEQPSAMEQMLNRRRPIINDFIGAHVGHKFKQCMLSVHPNIEPNTNEPVYESKQFNVVYEAKLNNHRILYAAEVDGIIIDKKDKQLPVQELRQSNYNEILNDLRTRKFVELKTCEKTLDDHTFRQIKIIDMWAQTFFAGVDTIVVGLRNPDGIVQFVNNHPSSYLLTVGMGSWVPDVCLSFCDAFLNFVNSCFIKELSKISENLSVVDLKDIKIDLFFQKGRCRADIVCQKSRRRSHYLYNWVLDGLSEKNKNP